MQINKIISLLLSVQIALYPVFSHAQNIIRLGADIVEKESTEENWIEAAPVYSDWTSGSPYDCQTWIPDPATYDADADFKQTSDDCKIDQSRTKQEREYETTSGIFRNVGEPIPEELTYLNQADERDYRIRYSTWTQSGQVYGCNSWTPSSEQYAYGVEFTQTATDCKIDQQRTRKEESGKDDIWTQESLTSESRTLTEQTSSRTMIGSAELPAIDISAIGEVFVNEPLLLSWTSSNVTLVTLSANNESSGLSTTPSEISGSSLSVTPTASGTYTYTAYAKNSADQGTSDTANVIVYDAPEILSLTTDRSQVSTNGSVILSWTHSGNGTLSIDNGIGVVSGNSISIGVGNQPGTKSYTLTTSKTINGITKQDQASVSVEVIDNPVITLTNSPSSQVFTNAPFSLSWSATNAIGYSIKSNNNASGVSATAVDLNTATSTTVTPSAPGTYTYTITATNATGATNAVSKTVEVVTDPTISAFSATPSTVTAGNTTSLLWTTSGASALSINQSVGAVTGSSTSVAVGSTLGNKTYTLTASKTLNGVSRTATASTTVSVISAPTVSVSTAPSTNVFANAAFNLGWTGTGATNYKIHSNSAASGISTTDIDLGTSTSRSITPTTAGSYTYTITATNGAGTTSSTTRTVVVDADPNITGFTASPTTITAGGSTTLSWTASGSTSLSIDQSVGVVTGASTSVAVGSTLGNKTYTLTASKALNGVTRTDTASITVNVISAPTVSVSTAPSTNVFANAAFTLGWTGTGATAYKIRGNSASSGISTTDIDLGTATSRSITPTAAGSYTYTITAVNAAGSTSATTRTVVVDADPIISSFSASPTSVTAGGSTTLTWATSGATSLSINQSVGAVTGTSKSVAVGTTAGTKTYTLTASKTLNGVTRSDASTASVTVIAGPLCEYIASNTYWGSGAMQNIMGQFRVTQVYYRGTVIFSDTRPLASTPVTSFSYNGKTWTVGNTVSSGIYYLCSQ